MDGFQAAICAVLVALNCGEPREHAQTDSATVACFRGLEAPYTFAELALIKDGGSMHGVVRGARDEQQSFFYECSMLNRRCGIYIGTENPWIGPRDHTKWGRRCEATHETAQYHGVRLLHEVGTNSDCEAPCPSVSSWPQCSFRRSRAGQQFNLRLPMEVAISVSRRLIR